MPALRHFDAITDANTLLAAIRSDGAIIIDKLVGADTVAALRRETDPYMEASENGEDDFTGRATTRTGGLVSRSAGVRELIGYAMGQYALGYYTPPGPPGAGPETVSPAYALGREGDHSGLGDSADLEAALAKVNQDPAS